MNYEQIEIEKLIPNTENPRKISQRELQKLKRSLQEFGFVEPVVVNMFPGREYAIIGGHQRTVAAKELGMKTVPVFYVNLRKEQEEQLNIALNKISGDWDETKLADMLSRLIKSEGDISLTGFDEPDIDRLMRSKEKLAEKAALLESIPTTPVEPKTKPGEIWQCGDHLVMCGDATNEAEVRTLCKEQKIQLCIIDPPYGVSYGETNHNKAKDWDLIINDELTGDPLKAFLQKVYMNLHKVTAKSAALYSFYETINHIQFEEALKEAGYKVKQQLIWTKNMTLGRSDYHWAHETILYCSKKEQNCEFYGDRTNKTLILTQTIESLEELKKEELLDIVRTMRENSDILAVKKDSSNSYQHPTQKPVDLLVRMIKNSSRPTDIIIDTCGGSGSLLMACEVSGRKARIMEITPKYCDVIIERWHKYTGKMPVRLKDHTAWDKV